MQAFLARGRARDMTELRAAPSQRALLLIDLQDDFLHPYGRMPVCPAQVAPVLAAAGRAAAEALPLTGIQYVPTWASSAFVNPDLDAWLRANGVGTLALDGLLATACIAATCRDALAQGYGVELVSDAIACRSDASRGHALARLARKDARITGARHDAPARVTASP